MTHRLGRTNERTAGECLRENCWYTFQREPVAVHTRHRGALGQLMRANDYSHSDSTWPHSREVIERDFEGVPEAELTAILHDKAAVLDRIEV